MQEKESVGSISSKLIKKDPETRNPKEIAEAMLKDYVENLWKCVEEGKTLWDCDFFVTVLTKKERLMQNVVRNYFMARRSCPTPNYEQAVYKYHVNGDHLEHIWVVPDKQAVTRYLHNIPLIHPSEYDLLKFIIAFDDGSLLRLCKQLNNETGQADDR